MNNQDTIILSKESKDTLMDFFVLKKNGCKKRFELFLTQENLYSNKLWDLNTSIVNYFLEHDSFRISETSLKNLSYLSKDWSSPNINNENSLFF